MVAIVTVCDKGARKLPIGVDALGVAFGDTPDFGTV